jgi:hypothetical protein
MARSSVHEQHSHPTLPPAKLQKLESLSLYYNLPEAAIICTECGFAIPLILGSWCKYKNYSAYAPSFAYIVWFSVLIPYRCK